MASESAPKAMNGNYAAQQPYDQQSQVQPSNSMTGSASSGAFSADQANTPSTGHSASSTTNEGKTSVPKDEVGWYFVEQYYTTLSKNPEKLHVSFAVPLAN